MNDSINSGEIRALVNLVINFDREVIPTLVEDDDLDNYTRVIEEVLEMQNTLMELYEDLYPPYRLKVQELNDEYKRQLKNTNK